MDRRNFYHHLMQLGAIGAVIYSTSCLAAKQELPTQSRSGGAATTKSAANAQPAPLTREAVSGKLQAEFQTLDTNKDGFLSQAEIAAGVSARRTQIITAIRKRRDAAFVAMDTNKDGQLSRDEFLAGGPKFSAAQPDGSQALKRFDTNKDGKVSQNEYLTVALAAFDRQTGNRTNVTKAPADTTKKPVQSR
jgi:Ca2+-binding EF-hand superfamily protein